MESFVAKSLRSSLNQNIRRSDVLVQRVYFQIVAESRLISEVLDVFLMVISSECKSSDPLSRLVQIQSF